MHRRPDTLPDKPAVRRRSAEPVRRRRGRRPPRDDPRRRPARADRALPDALRAARRAEVLAGRSLRLLRLARRLDQQVRPVEPEDGGRGARRHQHAQRRGVRRRPLRDGRQLPAAHAGGARRARPVAGQGDPGRRQGRQDSRVSAVYDAAPRKSFVVALKDIPEVWEIPYDRRREPVYEGLVHDYRHGEGVAEQGPFPVRRIVLDDILDDFFFDPSYDYLIGAVARRRQGPGRQPRRRAARSPTSTCPACRISGSGITWEWHGRAGAGHAEPQGRRGQRHRHEDVEDGQARSRRSARASSCAATRRRPTPGSTRCNGARQGHAAGDRQAHAGSRAATLAPAPGKTAAHVEFTATAATRW